MKLTTKQKKTILFNAAKIVSSTAGGFNFSCGAIAKAGRNVRLSEPEIENLQKTYKKCIVV